MLLFAIASALAFSATDDDPLKALLTKVERLHTDYPQEKVHLHLDKPYYSIGDTIWFKAYVVNAEKNRLSALSKILYVDIINDKDSVKKALRLPLISGLAWGDFTLTDSLHEGNYRIRAYTNWMRNFGEEYYFDKTISIGNALTNTVVANVNYTFSKAGNGQKVEALINYADLDGKPVANKEVTYEVVLDFRSIAKGKGVTDDKGNLAVSFVNNQPFILKAGKINISLKLADKQFVYKNLPVKSTSNAVDVQFFPESGQLVDSIRSRVAFKAVNANGLGEDVSGYVVDRDNNRIAELKSQHAGMGSFVMTPVGGNTYTAIIAFADGSEKRVDLPSAISQGYVLSVANTDTANLNIKISASRNFITGNEITLIAQSNGVVQYVSKTKLDKPVIAATVPRSRFPTGILQLTLFSKENLPVAERLVFIKHNDQLQINLATNKPSFGSREKAHMDINVSDPAGKPIVGSFSVSVTNITKVPVNESAETTILSNLLLSSDIKGYVEKPNYYFTNAAIGNAGNIELDNLMLTQGWRRFEWKNLRADVFPPLTFKAEQSLAVSGKVVTPNGGAVAGGKVTLFTTAGNGAVLETVTALDGRFAFENLSFNDSTSFLVQARNAKGGKNVEIELDIVPGQAVTKNKNAADAEININTSLAPYLAARRSDFDQMRKQGMLGRSIVLAEVKVSEKKAAVQHSSNLNGAGSADAVIKADQLQNCFSLAQCLQGRVAGLMIINGAAYLTRSMSFSGRQPMQLVVDGMYLEASYLGSINPADVETIEVLKSAGNTAIYGINGSGGVLIITTKRGQQNMAYSKYAPGVITYAPKGYYAARQFYSPNYEKAISNASLPDMRTTIYWNPNIIINKDGKSGFDFFTGAPGTYRAVIEGVGLDGKLGRKAIVFDVK